MKLLIVTQTLDTEDPILGFFVRWVEEFAKNCEQVNVLALNVGSPKLPENVQVHCLGKSEGKSKIVWLWRLWRHSFTLRHSYDAVFVHMNPEYVLFGAPVWHLLRKKIGLWYAHGTVSMKLKMAQFCSHFIFTSTEKGFRINSKKRKVVGQGIDTRHFSPSDLSKPAKDIIELVTVGRIGQAKNLEEIIRAGLILKKSGKKIRLNIVGAPQQTAEVVYLEKLKQTITDLKLTEEVVFTGPISNNKLPITLRECSIFINAGQTGSLDKALLEAVSCGIITVSSNEAYTDFAAKYKDILTYTTGDHASLAMKITNIVQLSNEKKIEIINELRLLVTQKHSIDTLITKILAVYGN